MKISRLEAFVGVCAAMLAAALLAVCIAIVWPGTTTNNSAPVWLLGLAIACAVLFGLTVTGWLTRHD